MKKSYKIILIISLLPIIILFEMLYINLTFSLIRMPSDISVIVGVLLMCMYIFLNFLLIKQIYKFFKTKKS